jgi:transcriptional regulator with XRE-family HTH domain
MIKAKPDPVVVSNLGLLLQATRKHLGMNQTALAPQLGLDQSALSRVESGKQMLTAVQWFTFCEIAGMSPDALTYGFVELDRPESAIRLPVRYASKKHSKVRSLLPLLNFAKGSLGERGYDSFLSDNKVDPDFFVNLNASINFNFTLDLIEALLTKTKMSGRDAESVTRTLGEKNSHGSLHHFYDFIAADPLKLIAGYVENASQYGDNFKYEVLGTSKDRQLDIAVTPLPHMNDFPFREKPVVGEFLAHYDKGLFQNLSTYGGKKPLKVAILEDLYKDKKASRSVYRLQAVG